MADEGESKARFIVEKRKEHLRYRSLVPLRPQLLLGWPIDERFVRADRALFASFGPILAVREQWAKEFVFVLYKEPEDAARYLLFNN